MPTDEQINAFIAAYDGIPAQRHVGHRRVRIKAALAAAEAQEVKPDDVRKWFHYPIIMPITSDGKGPATVGKDAAKITFEVWDQLYNSHGSFGNLPDAINEAMRLNAGAKP